MDPTDPAALDDGRRAAIVDPAPDAFRRAVTVMARLRAPNGCPWDAEQTHASLARHLLEETYETLEAIDSGDPDELQDELGDLLLQVLFHAEIAWEEGAFTIADVLDNLTSKLVRRHPHVFGDAVVASADEVVEQWERRKRAEERPDRESVLDGVPLALPGLARTAKLRARAARAGFDYRDAQGAGDHVREELDEALEAIEHGDRDRIEEELGDLLFVAGVFASVAGVQPEDAIRRANAKFERRFRDMEASAAAAGRPLESLSRDEWREYWTGAKTRSE